MSGCDTYYDKLNPRTLLAWSWLVDEGGWSESKKASVADPWKGDRPMEIPAYRPPSPTIPRFASCRWVGGDIPSPCSLWLADPTPARGNATLQPTPSMGLLTLFCFAGTVSSRLRLRLRTVSVRCSIGPRYRFSTLGEVVRRQDFGDDKVSHLQTETGSLIVHHDERRYIFTCYDD